MGKNAVAALLGIFALGFVVFMFNRTFFGGPNIEKLTPKTTTFECVNPKCKFHADYAVGEGPSHADPDVKLFQGDVFWKCIKCQQHSFHTAPMTPAAEPEAAN